MAELTERQVKEQDIDWYCLINGRPTHIASMGGLIPKKFRDREELRFQQDSVALMEPFADVKLNTDAIKTQIAEGYEYLQDELIRAAVVEVNRDNPGFAYLNDEELPIRLFVSTFVEKARRGFRSFARCEGTEGNEYVLIAEPSTPVEYKGSQYPLMELECVIEADGNSISF